MDNIELVKAIEQLRKDNEELRRRMEKAEAVNEIQRLMGKYYFMHNINPDPKFEGRTMWDSWKLFANRPDSSVEIASQGILMGIDNIRAFYEPGRPYGEHGDFQYTEAEFNRFCNTGSLYIHTLATPMIVVAEDCQTARGVWASPGHETFRVNGELLPTWNWGNSAADFIKEDGQWKIWHYHWYRQMRATFHTPWTEMEDKPTAPRDRRIWEELGADFDKILPSSYWHPYNTNGYWEPMPFAPEPYETWTDDRFPI